MNTMQFLFLAAAGGAAYLYFNQPAQLAQPDGTVLPAPAPVSWYQNITAKVNNLFNSVTSSASTGSGLNMTEDAARAEAYSNIAMREGTVYTVRQDSLGNLSVGVGHKVTFADGLQYGQTVSNEWVLTTYDADFEPAFNAAKSQAAELGKYTPEFIAALTSVNFQLGTGWRSKFPDTWAALSNGDYLGAIQRLNLSAWRQQTPVRVADFTTAIQNAYA